MSFIEDKIKKKIFFYSVIISVLFLIFIVINAVKVSNDSTCGVFSNEQLTVASYENIVLNNDSFISQEVNFDRDVINYADSYYYCLRGSVNSSKPLSLSVLFDDDVVGRSLLSNDSDGSLCVDIGSPSFSLNNNIVGFRCDNCDEDNFLNLYSALSVSPTIIDGSLTFFNSLFVDVKMVSSCRLLNFKLFRFWLIFVGLVSLIWLIDWFVSYIDEVSFGGW